MTGALSEHQLYEAAEELGFKLNPIKNIYELGEVPNGANIVLVSLPETPDTGHWVAIYKTKDYAFYFDPLGFRPPQRVKNAIHVNRGIYYNMEKIQPITQNHCGSYSLLFLRDMIHGRGGLFTRFRKHVSRYTI